MGFMDFLSRHARPVEAPSARAAAPAAYEIAPESSAAPPPIATAAAPPDAEDVDAALEMLKTIQDVLQDNDNGVLKVPARALLQNLPEPLRGAAWQPQAFPDVELELPRDTTLKQLRKGRVSFPLGDYLPVLPEGWVQAQPAALVDFDLALVVQAVPAEWLLPEALPSKQLEAVRHIPDYFKPAESLGPAGIATQPPPEPTPVTPPIAAPAAADEMPSAAAPPAAAAADELQPSPVTAAETPPLAPAAEVPAPPSVVPEPQPLPAEVAATPPPAVTEEQPAPAAVADAQPALSAAAETPAPPAVVPEAQPAPSAAGETPAATAPETQTLPAETAATPLPPPAAPPRPLAPGEWSGLEPALDISVRSVDLNRATETDLLRLLNIGPWRAQAILQYRVTHGPFTSIFELADVPGIGRKLFRQITGLTLRRKDRHAVLNHLLGLPDDAHPTLPQLMGYIRDTLAAAGCVLSNVDGIALAASGLPEEPTARYAALLPQLVRRARRYLAMLDARPQACLALPDAEWPLLCYRVSNFILIVALPAGSPLDPVLPRAGAIARELHWLLGYRLVVRA